MGILNELTLTVAFAVTSVSFGTSFNFGYQLGVINAPAESLRAFYRRVYLGRYGEPLDDDTLRLLFGTVTIGMIALGGFVGAMSVGLLCDSIGRKKTIMVNALIFLVGSLLMGAAKPAESYELIIVGRFIVGFGSGLCCGAVPTYINEIVPVSLRGALGSIPQFAIVVAIVVAMVMGNSGVWGNEDNWHLLLGFTTVNAVFQLATIPFCPDSPAFLVIKKSRDEEARSALKFFRRTPDVDYEMEELQEERDIVQSLPTVTLRQLFSDPMLRAPLKVAVVCHLAQQLSGINAIIAFSTDILRNGLGDANAEIVTIVTAVVNFAVTVVSVLTVEKFGRRLLLIGGQVLIILDTLLLTAGLLLDRYYGSGTVNISHVETVALNVTSTTASAPVEFATWPSYIVATAVVLYVGFFAIGPASITWFITGEIFGQAPRAAATTISLVANYFGNCVTLFGFKEFEQLLGDYTFLIFTTILVMSVTYLYMYMPETRNKTIGQLQAEFAGRLGRAKDSERSLARLDTPSGELATVNSEEKAGTTYDNGGYTT